MSLQIKDGKFWDGQNFIPAEIGNAEQIKCLRQYESEQMSLAEGQVVRIRHNEKTTYTPYIYFTCICGHENKIELDEDEDEATNNYFVGEEKRCPKCNENYQVIEVGKKLIVKIKPCH